MSDLSSEQQEHVRAALRFLHARSQTWAILAKALHAKALTLCHVSTGKKAASAGLAVRVARFAGVGVDEVLEGRFPPPGTCPWCGHREEASGSLLGSNGAHTPG
jgi:hypothetical protein